MKTLKLLRIAMILLSIVSIGLSIYERNFGAFAGWGCSLVLTILLVDNEY